MYLFNIFKESKDNEHFATIIIYSCKKAGFEKTSYILPYIPNVHLYFRKYITNQNKDYTFKIRKNWSCRYENLQSVAILHRKLKVFIFIFSVLFLLLSKIFSVIIFKLVVSFKQYQIFWNLLTDQKVVMAQKTSAMSKKN